MSARNAKRLVLLLAAILFAFHVQAMGNTRPPVHQHVAAQSTHHPQEPCGSGCCKDSACCVQAVEVTAYQVPERHTTSFPIEPHRVLPLATSGPPDPPPRSFVV